MIEPFLQTPALLIRFRAGQVLRAWLDTPTDRHALTVEVAIAQDDEWQLLGAFDGLQDWTWRGTTAPIGEGRWHCELTIGAETGADVALAVALTDLGAAPRWLIPATFYDDNRPADAPRRYPRFGAESDPWSATAWCFSAERAAAPFTSVRTETGSAALIAASPYWNDQPVGLGLDAAHNTSLLLRYPCAETPRSYAPCRGDDCAPDALWQSARAGDKLQIEFEIDLASATPRYPALLRELYDRAAQRGETATKPWLPMRVAAELLADGLLRWHYDPQTAVLAETCAFDHYFRPTDRQIDRAAMHVAWLSGIPTAFALLRQGGAAGEAGRRVIDHIARDGLAPCGAFWAQWTPDGWSTCWYGPPENAPPWLQAATTAEATVFLLQAISYERNQGRAQPGWEAAARSNLEFIAQRQHADGNLGSYYDAQTGDVMLSDGTPSVKWIAALVAGWRVFGDQLWLDVALRAADYYAPFVLDDRLRGAPEDVPLGPTSEDGYCALRAYWDLYEATRDRRWLSVARHAADWTLTFRWQGNVRFDRRTLLGQLDFRTVGADLASPSNQHLHTYGLIVLPELLKLWQATGDTFYFTAARDLLGFARQTLARVDGECNARRGMLTEQWYHVDWTHPKGSLLQLAHAWCNGLAIYAFQEAARWGEIWLADRVWCLEPTAQVDPADPPDRLRLRNPFDAPLTLRVRLRDPWRSLREAFGDLTLQEDDLGLFSDLTLQPGEETTLVTRT